MIAASETYKNLVKSNVRPKCEPVIRVYGKDNSGNDVEIIWRAQNIKDLTFKRGIDPVGREAPFMELTWSEIYLGKLNAENYPQKYSNIGRYMAVELSFVQTLNTAKTWKTWKELFSGNIKWSQETWKMWKDLFSGNVEWNQETFKMPIMFLEARPTIKGQTITWVARDIMSFLNTTQVYKSFVSPINSLRLFLLNERANFKQNKEMFWSLQETNNELKSIEISSSKKDELDGLIVFDDATKNLLVNYSSVYNRYFDFSKTIHNGLPVSVIKLHKSTDFAERNVIPVDMFVMYSNPTITDMSSISAYSFSHYRAVSDPSKSYELQPIETFEVINHKLYRYNFKKYGQTADKVLYQENIFKPSDPNFSSPIWSLTNNQDGTYLLKGGSLGMSFTQFVIGTQELPVGTYTISLQGDNVTSTTNGVYLSVYKDEQEIGNTITNKTFTFDSVGGEYSIRLSIDEFTNASNGATLKVMLNEGTESKDFVTTEGKKVTVVQEINYAVAEEPATITVTPIDLQKQENYIATQNVGEPFEEDNKTNPYSMYDVEMTDRLAFLQSYFNQNQKVVEIQCLPNLMIETGDIVDVETNLYEGENTIRKNCVVVQEEYSYNGALKQKIIAHEVSLS